MGGGDDRPSHHYTALEGRPIITIPAEKVQAELKAAQPDTAGRRHYDVELELGQTSWHPGSTRSTYRAFTGPIRLRYVLWPDGGVDVAER